MKWGVIVAMLAPGMAMARGFSTVLPLTVPLAVSPDAPSDSRPGLYVAAPVPHVMAMPPPERTTAGKLVDLARAMLSIGGDGRGTYRDPHTGTLLEPFGRAYMYSSPVARGLAEPGETVGN